MELDPFVYGKTYGKWFLASHRLEMDGFPTLSCVYGPRVCTGFGT